MSDPLHIEAPGVLPSQWIEAAVAAGVVHAAEPIEAAQIQPNSLDLRVGRKAYRLRCSFLPTGAVRSRIDDLCNYWFHIDDDGAVLEPDQVYLVPLMEGVALPQGVCGRANPKSSSGRLDVFCRVLADNAGVFDEVPPGYEGPLWLEIVPKSFAVRIRPGERLAQVRFAQGDALLPDAEVRRWLDDDPILVDPAGSPLRSAERRVSRGVYLSVRLSGRDGETVGYKARKHTPPIDLREIGGHTKQDYWDRLTYRKSQPLILEPDSFYIFASWERVRLPPTICGEMVPFEAGQGEVRTHYAGFFDSGFGWAPGEPASISAASIVLEVRNRDVPFLLEDGQPLFRVELLRNAAVPDLIYGQDLKSNYQGQRLKLAKQFRDRSSGGDEDELLPDGRQLTLLG